MWRWGGKSEEGVQMGYLSVGKHCNRSRPSKSSDSLCFSLLLKMGSSQSTETNPIIGNGQRLSEAEIDERMKELNRKYNKQLTRRKLSFASERTPMTLKQATATSDAKYDHKFDTEKAAAVETAHAAGKSYLKLSQMYNNVIPHVEDVITEKQHQWANLPENMRRWEDINRWLSQAQTATLDNFCNDTVKVLGEDVKQAGLCPPLCDSRKDGPSRLKSVPHCPTITGMGILDGLEKQYFKKALYEKGFNEREDLQYTYPVLEEELEKNRSRASLHQRPNIPQTSIVENFRALTRRTPRRSTKEVMELMYPVVRV